MYNGDAATFYANGYNLNNKYGASYTLVPSLFRNRLNVVNGASLSCGTFYATLYGGSNGDIREKDWTNAGPSQMQQLLHHN